MPKISIVLATARPNYPMPFLPQTHIFEPICSSLARQDFRDFELVVSDIAYDLRPDYFIQNPQQYSVKHIKFENEWTKRGICAISGTFNEGIVHVHPDTSLVIFIGDCMHFPMKYALDLYWEYYKQNLYATAFADGVHGDKIIEDDRKKTCMTHYGGICRGRAGWGVMSASLEICIKMDGFEEIFDGSKCQEDCNFSDRLTRMKYLQVMDNRLFVHCQLHSGYAMNTWGLPTCTRCNASVGHYLDEQYKTGNLKANLRSLTNEEYEIIKNCPRRNGDICYTREPATCGSLGDNGKTNWGHMQHPDSCLLKYIYPPKSIAERRNTLWGK